MKGNRLDVGMLVHHYKNIIKHHQGGELDLLSSTVCIDVSRPITTHSPAKGLDCKNLEVTKEMKTKSEIYF